MTSPLFSVGDTVYLKESAELGFLEAARVGHVMTSTNEEWVYGISLGGSLPSAPTFGDRIHYRKVPEPYYNESELLSFCDAADFVEDFLSARLVDIRALRADRC